MTHGDISTSDNCSSKGPLISVIVPIYNIEQYVEKCINSICMQDYKNLEIILVDDGSTDRCGEICDKLAQTDQRIVVIHKKNGGLSDARNTGIEKANGEFYSFIDGDDWIAPKMISALYERIDEDESDIAQCGAWSADTNDQILITYTQENQTLTGFQALELLDGDTGVLFGVTWNKLYRKKLFNDVRFPYGKCHEDVFVMHELFDQCKMVSLLSAAMYAYVRRDGSITQEKYSLRRLDSVEGFYKRYQYYRNKSGKYLLLLPATGEDVAVQYYQGKQHFKPSTTEEKKRVREIDQMARTVCFDRFWDWSTGMKIKFLAPSILKFISRLR